MPFINTGTATRTALAASVSGSKVWLFPIPLVELSCAAAALAVSEARTCPSTHIQNHDHNHIAQRYHDCAFCVSRQREMACLTRVSVCCLCQPVGTAADRGVHGWSGQRRSRLHRGLPRTRRRTRRRHARLHRRAVLRPCWSVRSDERHHDRRYWVR